MFIPKKYGQSKLDKCPFCQRHATAMNKQKIPVCASHEEEILDNLRCVCGSGLEMLNGKFGVFFSCTKCGNMSLSKVLEFNAVKPLMKNKNFPQSKAQAQSQEMTVRSDDPRYFD